VFYQTNDRNTAGDKGFFDTSTSNANVGIQLNLGADLGNNFTFGSQLTYVGTSGLEKNLVGPTGIVQAGGTTTQGSTTDDIALTKIFIAKQIANTTLKIGRQELPGSLSPLAFSEGWSVYKNTFDAIVAINTDLPNTTLVGAYVSGGTDISDLDGTADLGDGNVMDGAYMITASTTAIPMSTVTASYYTLKNVDAGNALGLAPAGTVMVSADALWLDAKIGKDLPMGLAIGLQYGNLDHDGAGAKDTSTYGIKLSAKPMDALTVCAAYTDVDDGDLPVVNYGTMVKSPLFTQMILNQGYINSDNDTWMLKASYDMGDMGSITAQYGSTDDTSAANVDDYTELDVIYKLNAGGVNYFASYSMTEDENGAATSSDRDMIRVWARYNF
jgi:hypothetical protein